MPFNRNGTYTLDSLPPDNGPIAQIHIPHGHRIIDGIQRPVHSQHKIYRRHAVALFHAQAEITFIDEHRLTWQCGDKSGECDVQKLECEAENLPAIPA